MACEQARKFAVATKTVVLFGKHGLKLFHPHKSATYKQLLCQEIFFFSSFVLQEQERICCFIVARHKPRETMVAAGQVRKEHCQLLWQLLLQHVTAAIDFPLVYIGI